MKGSTQAGALPSRYKFREPGIVSEIRPGKVFLVPSRASDLEVQDTINLGSCLTVEVPYVLFADDLGTIHVERYI